jgi:signal transduction histidine kinase
LTALARTDWVNYAYIDVLMALLVAGHAISATAGQPAHVVGLLLVETLCIAFRRRAPLLVLTVSGLAFCLYQVSGFPAHPLPFAPLIAVYTVAVSATTVISAVAGAALGAAVLAAAAGRAGPLDDDVVDTLGILFAGWILGQVVRLGQARAALLEAQARELQRDQEERARLAVEQERSRIARELHDIIAHNVSVMVAQAGAGRRVFDHHPAQAREALGSIETVGREALGQMRWLVGLLHAETRGRSWVPQPGLAQLPQLVAQIERAGLPVQVISNGKPRPLPAGIELNAYRIIQEALTNSLKHAGPTHAEVVLSYYAKTLELTIRDEGRGSAPLPPGHGLVGMRERVALLGGKVAAGPRPGGGFEVAATLPVNGWRAG